MHLLTISHGQQQSLVQESAEFSHLFNLPSSSFHRSEWETNAN